MSPVLIAALDWKIVIIFVSNQLKTTSAPTISPTPLPLLCFRSFSDAMDPHANQNSNWCGAEGTWISIKTQRPCSSRDKKDLMNPESKLTLADRFACAVAEKTPHMEKQTPRAFAYDLCVSCEGRLHHVCWMVPRVGGASGNLNQSLLKLRTTRATHTYNLRSMHTHSVHIHLQTQLSGCENGLSKAV